MVSITTANKSLSGLLQECHRQALLMKLFRGKEKVSLMRHQKLQGIKQKNSNEVHWGRLRGRKVRVVAFSRERGLSFTLSLVSSLKLGT